jgi:hypothetical protein
MINPDVDKLFNGSSQPKERHPNEEKITQTGGRKFFRKGKTHDGNKHKEINQPLVEDVHDGLIDLGDFFQLFMPVKQAAKPQMKNCKGKAIRTAQDDECMICHLFTELEEMSKFKQRTTRQVDLGRINGVFIPF